MALLRFEAQQFAVATVVPSSHRLHDLLEVEESLPFLVLHLLVVDAIDAEEVELIRDPGRHVFRNGLRGLVLELVAVEHGDEGVLVAVVGDFFEFGENGGVILVSGFEERSGGRNEFPTGRGPRPEHLVGVDAGGALQLASVATLGLGSARFETGFDPFLHHAGAGAPVARGRGGVGGGTRRVCHWYGSFSILAFAAGEMENSIQSEGPGKGRVGELS